MAKIAAGKNGKSRPSPSKPSRTATKPAPKARNRRSPAQLLGDLQAERDLVAVKLGARLAKLEDRIAKVEARYDTQLRLDELTQGASMDDLQEQLDEAKRQQKLLRMALKAKR
jgi:hypothetical protein